MFAILSDATPPSDWAIIGRFALGAIETAVCSAMFFLYATTTPTKPPRQIWRILIAGLPFYIFGLALINAYRAFYLAHQQSSGPLEARVTSKALWSHFPEPSLYDHLRTPEVWWTAALAEKYIWVGAWYTFVIFWSSPSAKYLSIIGSCIGVPQVIYGFTLIWQHYRQGVTRYQNWTTVA